VFRCRPVLYFCRPAPVSLVDHALPPVLVACRTARRTGELATSQGVFTPSASQHTAQLRDAGLLVTVRQAERAPHVATALRHALIRGTQNDNSREEPDKHLRVTGCAAYVFAR
jgi:hypothetical protein